jgi:hypothetical protein
MPSLIALKPRAVALLRAAILFAAKADAREQLTAVCVDPDPAAGRVRIVATNKHVMFIATAPAQLYGKTAPVLLSAASLKPALSAFRAADIRRAGVLTIDPGSRYARLALVLADASAAIEDVLRDRENEIVSALATMADAQYVDYRRALPIPGAVQQATPLAAVNPMLLGTICKAAELLDDRSKVASQVRVRFFAADEHGPQCAAIASDAIAAVMPMRADSAEYAEYADVYATIF